MEVLQLQGIRKRFGGVQALRGASLTLAAGEVHAVIGENGAGKSTLMRLLIGAITADEGTMLLDGLPYQPRGPKVARRRGIAMVHQELALAGHLTVQQNIVLGREPVRWGVVSRAQTRAIACAALEAVGGGSVDPDARASSLGPGARQLVEIARAIAMRPRILILDEPTTSLGSSDAQGVYGAIERARDAGVAVVLISHHFREIRAIATRATVLRDGATVWSGALSDAPDDALVRWMTGGDLHKPGGGAVAAARTPDTRAPTAPAPATPAPAALALDTPAPAPLLRVDGIRSARMRRRATLEVGAGQVLGIAGLVGSGRTALLRAIAGLDAPLEGTRLVAGRVLDPRRGVRGALAAGVAFVSEDRQHEGLALGLPWAINLALPSLARLGRAGIVSRSQIEAAAQRARAALGIRAGGAWQRAGELSGGNQQKVAIARVLEAGARVLLLDEPTRGVDVAAKAQIRALVRSLALEGRAIIVVSSDGGELLSLCDTVALMRDGHLGAAQPATQVTEASLIADSFRGPAPEEAA